MGGPSFLPSAGRRREAKSKRRKAEAEGGEEAETGGREGGQEAGQAAADKGQLGAIAAVHGRLPGVERQPDSRLPREGHQLHREGGAGRRGPLSGAWQQGPRRPAIPKI